MYEERGIKLTNLDGPTKEGPRIFYWCVVRIWKNSLLIVKWREPNTELASLFHCASHTFPRFKPIQLGSNEDE